MRRIVTLLASVTALVAVAVAPVTAQVPQPAPRPAPGAPAGAPAGQKTMKELEGTVKKVDPAQKTVQISTGVLGLFGTTLRVADDTEIRIEGRKGSFTDIREGAKVKAAYEIQSDQNVAKSIDLMPAEQKEGSSPARPAPPARTPGSPAMPPAGQPKTQ